MPFTSRGREYSNIEGGLATRAFKPWGGKLKKLRKELVRDAISARKGRQNRAKSMKRNVPARRGAGRGIGKAASLPAIEQERKRRKLERMGLLKGK